MLIYTIDIAFIREDVLMEHSGKEDGSNVKQTAPNPQLGNFGGNSGFLSKMKTIVSFD
jgi:hypothetical protein